jgi:hypothetical protein
MCMFVCVLVSRRSAESTQKLVRCRNAEAYRNSKTYLFSRACSVRRPRTNLIVNRRLLVEKFIISLYGLEVYRWTGWSISPVDVSSAERVKRGWSGICNRICNHQYGLVSAVVVYVNLISEPGRLILICRWEIIWIVARVAVRISLWTLR